MNLFKKRKKRKPEVTLTEITARIRGFVLDSQTPDAHHISTLLGCSSISDEVADKEEDASDARVARVEHLIPILYAYARSMADGTVEHQRDHLEDDLDDEDIEVPPEAWASTRKAFTQVSFNTLVGAVSQLVDMGFLAISSPKKKGWFRK